ncbi:hypothetical protein HBI56_236510 [Parastagonospora nodorum]|uniref:Uncharacterized protein n=1 Tax=Phaeosphaeria nodorum (strain SN15 / ATCC MYA-4574 / FGSC 10173) TaxID=321614 RepID=A0A7U2HZ22_PHANO|nr:hypothetical protein HBH56_244290 [Parastagonospora nodorum]QRC95654.1 hypothetical protein JI435_407750 [Parastagonospora nodorum SN15]KAH3937063.1 hypothetical protein HBH54_011270 [Parastagonospora nodorum]KAH3967522.1 hypothetical protein HBH51_134730 [Parastagonospora nodorum]KAH4044289.1 hypothetical protein HBH49_222420 [Parastagonospora nodorum]
MKQAKCQVVGTAVMILDSLCFQENSVQLQEDIRCSVGALRQYRALSIGGVMTHELSFP